MGLPKFQIYKVIFSAQLIFIVDNLVFIFKHFCWHIKIEYIVSYAIERQVEIILQPLEGENSLLKLYYKLFTTYKSKKSLLIIYLLCPTLNVNIVPISTEDKTVFIQSSKNIRKWGRRFLRKVYVKKKTFKNQTLSKFHPTNGKFKTMVSKLSQTNKFKSDENWLIHYCQ